MNDELTGLLEAKTNEMYSLAMSRPMQVLDIFNNFFGEDKVDMQGYLTLDEFREWLRRADVLSYIPSHSVYNTNKSDFLRNKSIYNLSCEELASIDSLLTDNETITRIVEGLDRITILVHFPKVRVTNEYDRYTDITHLYAKVEIYYDGRLAERFKLNRAEYTLLHFANNYMHSHVRDIPKCDFTMFQLPCIGSGPICRTISALYVRYNEDTWNMFCLELSKYVEVESISGIPYHRLENISLGAPVVGRRNFRPNNVSCSDNGISRSKIMEFTSHFIKLKKLKFNYKNGSYSIGMSFLEYMLLISNEFINWYNSEFNKDVVHTEFQDLKCHGILKEVIISNGVIYYGDDTGIYDEYVRYTGRYMCTFKGRRITINITDVDSSEINRSVILNVPLSLHILDKILKVLNYRYGREKSVYKQDDQIGSEVKYL